jgi:hypothetical protein
MRGQSRFLVEFARELQEARDAHPGQDAGTDRDSDPGTASPICSRSGSTGFPATSAACCSGSQPSENRSKASNSRALVDLPVETREDRPRPRCRGGAWCA